MHIPKLKLAIADGPTLFRGILKNYLSQQPFVEVILQIYDIDDLFSKSQRAPIDILLLDVFLPHLNSNETLRHIRNENPKTKIIILSMCTDLHLINELLDIGIHGFVSKADEPEELLQAIRAASEGRIHRNKLLTEALYLNKQNNINTIRESIIIEFSEREKKIIQMLWKEKSNKEIADELFLSIRSIEKIRQDMKEKVGVKTTVGLLKYALKNKIIEYSPMVASAVYNDHTH